MKKSIIILSVIFLQVCVYAQKSTGKSAGFFRTAVYFDATDSTRNYAIVYHPNQAPKKMLVLLTAFGESPFLAENETTIPVAAASAGILTCMLSNNEGIKSLHIDGNAQAYLDSIIPILLGRYNIPKDEYYLGGFSMGGSGVIKYVQHCHVYDIQPKPKAVFAIDPPLDFLRLYKVYERWMDDTSSYFANKYLYKIMLDKMQGFFKGSPETAYENYLALSPYCYEDKNRFGTLLFENTPVTIYCEPDFAWGMAEKKWNAYDWNVLDNVSFINELNKNGNNRARIVLSQDKGFRKVLNSRYPHSWSIADAGELVKWLLKY